MNPSVLLLYCMLINKGRVFGSAIQRRMAFPLTVTEQNADSVIRQICDDIASDAGVDPELIQIQLNEYDFCHFRHFRKESVDQIRKVYTPKATKKSHFGSTFWRSK